jgi:hypothetical protein
VGHRLHDGLRDLKLRLTPPNPLKSEAGAFGFLIWFVCVVAAIVVIVLIIQAL